MSDGEVQTAERWLLLIHQIPPKPDYLRVKIGRRLQRVGAVPVKNSVYVLPDADQTYEDFQWIRREILGGGGDASICRAEFVDGLTSDEIRQTFRKARDADYAEITAAARALRAAAMSGGGGGASGGGDRGAERSRPARADEELSRLRKRLATVVAIDFFGASARTIAEETLTIADAELRPRLASNESPAAIDLSAYRGRTWVTRAGIFVDRIASAWLIRRFIDPNARFRFVREGEYRPPEGQVELRFDMFEAEFTHEGDRCTFETLLARFSLDTPPLRAIAEVVHDIDLKDAKFERDDAPGIERVLAGIAAAHPDDPTRLERGCQLFDELHALFSRDG